MAKFIIIALIMVGVVFILVNMTEVSTIAETLQNGDIRFILLAILLQAVWMINVSASYFFIYRALGLRERYFRLLLMSGSAYFVNLVAPTVGVGGLSIFVAEARRKGYSSARVTVAGAVVVMFDYLGFICVLVLGLIVLFRRNNLDTIELIASSLLIILAIVWGSLLYLGMKSERRFGRALARLANFANRLLRPFIHRNYVSVKRAFHFARDASGGLFLLRQKPINLVLPAILGLTSKLLLMFILLSLFLAFDVPFSIGTIVAGFSMGYLFWIISPTPSGIGFVEGALTLGLSSLNVTLGAATVIALAYRGITFWLPMLYGMLTFRWLMKSNGVQLASQADI